MAITSCTAFTWASFAASTRSSRAFSHAPAMTLPPRISPTVAHATPNFIHSTLLSRSRFRPAPVESPLARSRCWRWFHSGQHTPFQGTAKPGTVIFSTMASLRQLFFCQEGTLLLSHLSKKPLRRTLETCSGSRKSVRKNATWCIMCASSAVPGNSVVYSTSGPAPRANPVMEVSCHAGTALCPSDGKHAGVRHS